MQTRKRYEADVKRIQAAREALPSVETILGLDEMQVSVLICFSGGGCG